MPGGGLGGARSAAPADARPRRLSVPASSSALASSSSGPAYALQPERSSSCRSGSSRRSSTGSTTATTARSATSPSTSCRSSSSGRSRRVAGLALFLADRRRSAELGVADRDPRARDRRRRGARASQPRALRLAADHAPRAGRHRRRRASSTRSIRRKLELFSDIHATVVGEYRDDLAGRRSATAAAGLGDVDRIMLALARDRRAADRRARRRLPARAREAQRRPAGARHLRHRGAAPPRRRPSGRRVQHLGRLALDARC